MRSKMTRVKTLRVSFCHLLTFHCSLGTVSENAAGGIFQHFHDIKNGRENADEDTKRSHD
jgi:hypothetical protein